MIETNQDNADAIKAVELARDLEQLQNNDDRFKRVILEGFIDKVLNEASMNVIHPSAEVRDETLGKIEAVSYLKAYFEYVMNTANTYEEMIK